MRAVRRIRDKDEEKNRPGTTQRAYNQEFIFLCSVHQQNERKIGQTRTQDAKAPLICSYLETAKRNAHNFESTTHLSNAIAEETAESDSEAIGTVKWSRGQLGKCGLTK